MKTLPWPALARDMRVKQGREGREEGSGLAHPPSASTRPDPAVPPVLCPFPAAKEQSRAANWNDCRPNDINPSRIVPGWDIGCVIPATAHTRGAKWRLPAAPAVASPSSRPPAPLSPICFINDCGPCSQFESPSNTRSLSALSLSLH